MTVLQDIYNIDELCIFGFEWHQDNFDELQLLSGEESTRFLSFLLPLLRATLLCCLPDISSEKYFHSFHLIHDAR